MGAFPAAIIMGFMNYIKFSGFASRSEYWYWALFSFIMGALTSLADSALFHLNYDDNGPLNNVFSLVTFLPSLTVLIRRLRDAGHSWANIFWIFLPVIGWIILVVYSVQPSQHLSHDTYGYTPRY